MHKVIYFYSETFLSRLIQIFHRFVSLFFTSLLLCVNIYLNLLVLRVYYSCLFTYILFLNLCVTIYYLVIDLAHMNNILIFTAYGAFFSFLSLILHLNLKNPNPNYAKYVRNKITSTVKTALNNGKGRIFYNTHG
jgi:hypothetical protein